jgi:hypothetical protein
LKVISLEFVGEALWLTLTNKTSAIQSTTVSADLPHEELTKMATAKIRHNLPRINLDFSLRIYLCFVESKAAGLPLSVIVNER